MSKDEQDGEERKMIVITQEQPRAKSDIEFHGHWTMRDLNILFREMLRAFDKRRKAIVRESREKAKEEEDGR